MEIRVTHPGKAFLVVKKGVTSRGVDLSTKNYKE